MISENQVVKWRNRRRCLGVSCQNKKDRKKDRKNWKKKKQKIVRKGCSPSLFIIFLGGLGIGVELVSLMLPELPNISLRRGLILNFLIKSVQ